MTLAQTQEEMRTSVSVSDGISSRLRLRDGFIFSRGGCSPCWENQEGAVRWRNESGLSKHPQQQSLRSYRAVLQAENIIIKQKKGREERQVAIHVKYFTDKSQ